MLWLFGGLCLVMVEQAFHTVCQCYYFIEEQIFFLFLCSTHTPAARHVHFNVKKSKKIYRQDIPLDTLITFWTFPFHYFSLFHLEPFPSLLRGPVQLPSIRPLNFAPLLILPLLDLMLVGIFPVYSILNCNLVCIRNGAHVNKAW